MKKPDEQRARAASSLNLVDCSYTFAVTGWLRALHQAPAGDRQVVFAYDRLLEVVAEERVSRNLQRADASLAFVSSDLTSPSQLKFADALSRFGYAVERSDYRHNYVSDPSSLEGNRMDRPGVVSLAPNLAFVLGLVSATASSASARRDLAVVTGGFDLFNPIRHFIRRTEGRVLLCFFRRFLDARWAANGLFDPDSKVTFCDLEPYAERLLGIDLAALAPEERGLGRSGLDAVL